MRQAFNNPSEPRRGRRREKIGAVVSDLLKWYRVAARDLPWRRTRDPYAIWVSEVMLQQTQVKTVVRYWERWMRALPTIQALAAADSHTVHKLWEGLGYYSRVRNLQRAANVILNEHDGNFPREPDQIAALPGVGPYTSGAIRSIAFNHAAPLVDGNVARVLSRVFLVTGDPRELRASKRFWKLAKELVQAAECHPGRSCSECNQSLMELGAMVCTPASPLCGACPLQTACLAKKTGRQNQFPRLKPRPSATNRRFVAVVAAHDGKYLVRQRPTGVVNANLWEFPNMEVKMAAKPRSAVRTILGQPVARLEKFCEIRHTITRYRIKLEVLRAAPEVNSCDGHWFTHPELLELPFASAHKKILLKLCPQPETALSVRT